MVKFILIKSPDEWATTKQACRDELVVYVFFSSVYIYIYIYMVLNWPNVTVMFLIHLFLYVGVTLKMLKFYDKMNESL